ncbi:phytase [Streptomyces coelicoflavus]|uniref:phytase n=1 Tax=Streptomyces coelicoflavus TaxID=285562 RepID=UPI0024ADFEF1|nr:phytase [Streptomyces coelicoflavus]MDI6520171.1 phytase [Streptomyces coelicoflavus]
MHAFTRRRSRVVAAVATLMFTAAVAAVPSAQAAAPALPPAVVPRAETAAQFDDDQGGNANADDPAIWRNSADPDASLVIGTAKEGGLRVYDLDARQVQSVPAPAAPGSDDAPGRFNNVDLVHRTSSVFGATDLAVVSDRGSDKLRIYRVAGDRPDAPLTDVTDASAPWIFSGSQEEVNAERTAYGLATYTDSATGRSYALVSQNATTRIALLELITTRDGKVSYRKVRTLDLPAAFTMPDGTKWSPCGEPGEGPQVEGMVVDPETGVLFAGQEDVGVWRLRADLKGAPVLQDKVREYGVPATYDEASDECVAGDDPGFGGVRVSADVEGLTLLKQDDGDGYLLASSQGDDTFVAYDRERSDEYEYEGGFRVSAASESLDGSEECDGADVLAEPLGGRYPNGLLVVQDGHMAPEDGGREATGFKFVDLADVLEALDD